MPTHRPIRVRLEDLDDGLTKEMVGLVITQMGTLLADAGVVVAPTPETILSAPGKRSIVIVWARRN